MQPLLGFGSQFFVRWLEQNGARVLQLGAPVECQVGQNFDKFWTNIQVLSNICPTFVQVLSMSNICQNN